MLFRLLPAQDQVVLFSLSFPPLPRDFPYPPNWSAQLQRLSGEELEIPAELHALDASVSHTVLLDEVIFDLTSLTVSCIYIDGAVEEWPITDDDYIRLLEVVAADVDSAAEIERGVRVTPIPEPLFVPTPVKAVKHKKQRSLLMSLVASLSSFSLASPPRSAPLPLPVCPPTPCSTPAISPDAIRKRAHSSLVDTFRRHVLPELKARTPPGGYQTWVAQSMLRRSADHMAYLAQEAGLSNILYSVDALRHAAFTGSLPSPTPSFSFYDDEYPGLVADDGTETDSSSVHTPSSSKFCAGDFPRSPSPPQFAAEEQAQYNALACQCKRLHSLLLCLQAWHSNTKADEAHMLSVLEIKSKRRAFSNRQFKGGASMQHLGFTVPVRSSPLARFKPRNSAHLSPPPFLEVATGEHDVSRLFPVSEEDEDADEGFGPDLEIGLPLNVVVGGPGEYGFQRPQIRRRTSSMHRSHALELDPAMAPAPLTLLVPPPHPTLSASSLLCQPLKNAPRGTRLRDEETIFVKGYNSDGDLGSEFTLSMDLPYHDREKSQGYEQDEWLPGVIVDCR